MYLLHQWIILQPCNQLYMVSATVPIKGINGQQGRLHSYLMWKIWVIILKYEVSLLILYPLPLLRTFSSYSMRVLLWWRCLIRPKSMSICSSFYSTRSSLRSEPRLFHHDWVMLWLPKHYCISLFTEHHNLFRYSYHMTFYLSEIYGAYFILV